jgi:hypothetical protein
MDGTGGCGGPVQITSKNTSRGMSINFANLPALPR